MGRLKFGADDPDSPFFVVSGGRGHVVAWADCLLEGFEWPTVRREATGAETLTDKQIFAEALRRGLVRVT